MSQTPLPKKMRKEQLECNDENVCKLPGVMIEVRCGRDP